MNKELVETAKSELSGKSLEFKYDGHSIRSFLAQIVFFVMVFSLGLGLLFSRYIFEDPLIEIRIWNLIFALFFLAWSLFILVKALFLRPVRGLGAVIDGYGVFEIGKEFNRIEWSQIRSIFVFPWMIIIIADQKKIVVSSFLKDFSELSRLFCLLVFSFKGKKSNSIKYAKEAEVRSVLNSLESRQSRMTENRE